MKTLFFQLYKSCLLFGLLMCLSFKAQAQLGNTGSMTISGPTSVALNDTEPYTISTSILLVSTSWLTTPGVIVTNPSTYGATIQFTTSGDASISASSTDTFFNFYIASIQVSVSGSGGSSGGGTSNSAATLSDENYIYNITPQIAVDDISQIQSNGDALKNVMYYDGLGREKQGIAIQQSPNEEDIITHMAYDEFGRSSKNYLPFVLTNNSNNGGNYNNEADVINGINTYYLNNYADDLNSASPNPYSEILFEASPLNRTLKQAAPGDDWRMGSNHEIKFDYQTNSSQEVRYFSVNYNSSNTFSPQLVQSTSAYHTDSSLRKIITKDENWTSSQTHQKDHTTEEFTDRLGRMVLKRAYNENVPHDTYYVYDDFDNLIFVIPPKVDTSTTIDSNVLNELCYQYIYDRKNRLIEKKIPGKGWEYIIYNKLDQPIMTQDANLRVNNKWLFTKYDAFGRVAYTGMSTHTSTRELLQYEADGTTSIHYVTKGSQNTIANTEIYYNNGAFPVNGIEKIYTINYYDNYNFDTSGLTIPSNIYGVASATNTQGLTTGSKVRVLGTDNWITTITGYDTKGRSIYVASKNNYLNTTDSVESKLDFAGKVDETKTTHTKSGNAAIVTIDQFFYDHATRLVKQTQQINNGATEVIVENTYDEIGQLVDKGVGGKTTQNRLQHVDYSYNIRGWLKTINDVNNLGIDLFSFKINYNDADYSSSNPLYNGNISETLWYTANDASQGSTLGRGYSYTYDDLNRITSGTYLQKSTLTQQLNHAYGTNSLYSITYDKNGNILSLGRGARVAYNSMDNLVYDYSTQSNKLLKVTDNTTTIYKDDGFRDGTNTGNDYAYDANGNMTEDRNKGMFGIGYNHLNLPTHISTISNPSGSGFISYIYDANGVKQRKKVTNFIGYVTTETDYAGNYIYENGSLKFFNHPEGYVEPDGNSWKYVYQCKDHLGNVRLTYADEDGNGSVTSSEIREENNYYPFGLKHKGYNDNVSAFNNGVASKWKYNGKELNESLGLNLYEMDMRSYDPAIARWTSIDPITHYSMSPYNAFDNNPVFWADPSGADAITLFRDLWNRSGSGLTQYTNTGNGTFEETARATDEDFKTGKAILVAFPDQNPEIPSKQKTYRWFEKVFGDGDGKVQGAGHAGIVLINGESGLTRYFDFGRYNRPDLKGQSRDRTNEGAVRSSKNFGGLSVPNWDFSKSNEENVTSILTALHDSPVFRGYGTIMGSLAENLDFKAMLKYAEGLESNGYHPFGGHHNSVNPNNATYCAKFARGCAEAGGFNFKWYVLTGKQNVDDINRKNKNGVQTIKN